MSLCIGIENDQVTTLADFIKYCAKSMVGQYLLPNGDLPTSIKSGTEYFDIEIPKLHTELEDLRSLTEEQANIRAFTYYNTKEKEWFDYSSNIEVKREKYQIMLKQVLEWTPPDIVKNTQLMMVRQLEEAISDANKTLAFCKHVFIPDVRLSGKEWLQTTIETKVIDLLRCQTRYVACVNDTKANNDWLEAIHKELARL